MFAFGLSSCKCNKEAAPQDDAAMEEGGAEKVQEVPAAPAAAPAPATEPAAAPAAPAPAAPAPTPTSEGEVKAPGATEAK